MKFFLSVLIFFLPYFLFSENLFLNSESFGICETKKGYVDIYIINDNGTRTSVLDSGSFLNSRIYIKDGDRRFYLRNKAEYVVNVYKDTFNIKWRTDNVIIDESYKLTKTGFLYSIKLTNRSLKERSIGAIIMYDTFFGEDDNKHFLINNDEIIFRQKSYSSRDIPKIIRSENNRNQFVELNFAYDGLDLPDEIILGNWDRLAFSQKWPFKPITNSIFSYGFYSINDSAIGIVYNGRYLKSNSAIEYSFYMNLVDDVKVDIKTEVTTITNTKKWSKTSNKDDSIVDDSIVDDSIVDDSISLDSLSKKEELKIMLEYIQKKKNGEDVSKYNFDEKYILEKLKEINE